MGRTSKKDTEQIVSMYESGMSISDVAEVLGCCTKTVYRHLDGNLRRGRGGVVSSTIPKNELCKSSVEAVEAAAQKNAENASVILEDCAATLMGTVGMYTVSTKKKEVRCEIGDSVMYFKFDDLLGLIDELKGVGRCIKHFDIGNAMW